MSIYKRGKVYYYHFYFNGQHVQESTKQGNPRVARQMEAAHRTSLAKGEVGIRQKQVVPTLSQFMTNRIEPWARAMFEKTSVNTWRWYRAGLRSIDAYPQLANLKLDQVTAEAASDFSAHRQSSGGKKKAGLQVASVNASLRVLRRVLKLAVEWGVLPVMPKIRLLRGERHRERVITRKEEATYLAAASEPLASIATILADTGMRPDECYRLCWEHITFVTGKNGSLLITHGKTAAARRVLPLTARVRNILEPRWNKAGKPQDGWVWPSPTASGHADHSTIKKQHTRAFHVLNADAIEKGLPPVIRPFVLYAFRHTFLTRLAEAGCDAWTMAKIAGWSDISISKRYVHPSEDAVLSALAKMPAAEARMLKQ